jgi:hypothetical protein
LWVVNDVESGEKLESGVANDVKSGEELEGELMVSSGQYRCGT